mmetsp:Transcript_38471/g.68862  ORF Transcript_38471/g.68862 Transcript_38471/m.68862 type:complete len:220 (+) Transcript_38471:710-1369(+)
MDEGYTATTSNIVCLNYKFPAHFPALAKDFIKKILVLDPTQRPSLSTMLKHPWIQKYGQTPQHNPVLQAMLGLRHVPPPPPRPSAPRPPLSPPGVKKTLQNPSQLLHPSTPQRGPGGFAVPKPSPGLGCGGRIASPATSSTQGLVIAFASPAPTTPRPVGIFASPAPTPPHPLGVFASPKATTPRPQAILTPGTPMDSLDDCSFESSTLSCFSQPSFLT